MVPTLEHLHTPVFSDFRFAMGPEKFPPRQSGRFYDNTWPLAKFLFVLLISFVRLKSGFWEVWGLDGMEQ